MATQGATAVNEVVAALEELDADPQIDVIVIARGGGSLEDLLPFSNESLVRAVSEARTPVVSAIGHESDVPLLDLVADLAASTPTDAGKRIVPDLHEELARIDDARRRGRVAIRRAVTTEYQQSAGCPAAHADDRARAGPARVDRRRDRAGPHADPGPGPAHHR